MHEWMTDNSQTPLLIVDAGYPDVSVPESFVEDGRIVLNVSGSAAQNLRLDNEFVSFEARFAGAPHSIWVPVAAVQGIYARESGRGMMFQEEPTGSTVDSAAAKSADAGSRPPKRPGLRVVK
jgi:stringent starvation protein B